MFDEQIKTGFVTIIGRPNAGKSIGFKYAANHSQDMNTHLHFFMCLTT